MFIWQPSKKMPQAECCGSPAWADQHINLTDLFFSRLICYSLMIMHMHILEFLMDDDCFPIGQPSITNRVDGCKSYRPQDDREMKREQCN